jgi:predicted dehydrogenase
VIEGILGPIRRVASATTTAIPERIKEDGERYRVDVDDTSITLAELASGASARSYVPGRRVSRRDDLLTLQIDGTGGSAIAGLHRCWAQSAAETPTIRHFNPGVDIGADYRGEWKEVTSATVYTNPYRIGWERFIRHAATDAPLGCDLSAGIRDVQLAEACGRSAAGRKWISLDGNTG